VNKQEESKDGIQQLGNRRRTHDEQVHGQKYGVQDQNLRSDVQDYRADVISKETTTFEERTISSKKEKDQP